MKSKTTRPFPHKKTLYTHLQVLHHPVGHGLLLRSLPLLLPQEAAEVGEGDLAVHAQAAAAAAVGATKEFGELRGDGKNISIAG